MTLKFQDIYHRNRWYKYAATSHGHIFMMGCTDTYPVEWDLRLIEQSKDLSGVEWYRVSKRTTISMDEIADYPQK